MNLLEDYFRDHNSKYELLTFLEQFGVSGLKEALYLYTNTHQKYICKTKIAVSKINIYDISHLTIRGHNIIVHTSHGTYQKYGTLRKELDILCPYGFIKCNQSCIVSLFKIKAINDNIITLIDDTQIHISRNNVMQVITAFMLNK